MKDWLTVIIVLLIVGIVLDGIRRMRIARRESISLSKNNYDDSSFDVSSSEFPSGGARVANVRDENEVSSFNQNVRKSFESTRVTAGAPKKIPEQVSLNLEESVPMLMDSVENEASSEGEDFEKEYEAPAQEISRENVDIENDVEDVEVAGHKEPSLGNFDSIDDFGLSSPREASAQKTEAKSTAQATQSAAKSQYTPENKQKPREAKSEARPEPTKPEPKPAEQDQALYSEPEEVLIMNVMARPGEKIAGSDLLSALMAEGLKFGEMEIFHRHKENDGDGPILYSIANMVVPGTFNLAEMENFSTPGISIFLSLPVAGESISAYNDMASTAKNLAQQLGAELKDENRSVMTAQTIEHGRQRVIEYERKRKLAKA